MSQTSSSWELNWTHFKHAEDPICHKLMYPPISSLYLTFYRYLCDSAKEVNVLWSTIFEHISVKDLTYDYFQQHIQQLLLDVFTKSSTILQPSRMLPVMSLANKCKFINVVESEGVPERMELTKFKED